MAQLEAMISAEGNSVDANDGTSHLTEESITIIESSEYFNAQEEFTNTNTNNSIGWTPPSDPLPYSSEYFSTRIQSIMERRNEFGTNVESEIEVSKDHWSELQTVNDEESSSETSLDDEGSSETNLDEEGSTESNLDKEGSFKTNLEVFHSLQKQWPNGFFRDWNDEAFAVGDKIAEGGQAKIFILRFLKPEHAHLNDQYVLKVFKHGFNLDDLQKQWPKAMLQTTCTSRKPYYLSEGSCAAGGMLLKDGRFCFYITRYWGDLRTLINRRMIYNDYKAPPFNDDTTLVNMFLIAKGMRGLHRDNIVHRDLKAANVLISPGVDSPLDGFNPITDDNFAPRIADFECSVGVIGTGFWRAPEILFALKNRNLQPSLFTEKADVYSYAMTCYEILTGQIPMEGVPQNDYDVVLQGERPKLPSGTKPWIRSLLSRCWHHDPSQRPSFEKIIEGFHSNYFWGVLIA